MNVHIPENQTVLAHLRCKGRPIVSAPDSVPDPYMGLGSHPDIVERVWDQLGMSLSPDYRRIVCGTPALVHPASGLIFTLAYGTQYVLRLPPELATLAKQAGFHTTHHWSNGTSTDIEKELGVGWVFSLWSPFELQ